MFLIRVILLAIIFESQNAAEYLNSFVDHELVPDILATPPTSLVSVSFPPGFEVSEGQEMIIEEVQSAPILSWGAEEGTLYAVVMCDADAPSREEPIRRSILHWLKFNVMMDDVTTGDTVVDFLPSNPGPGTGLHRYVFLVYEQLAEITFSASYPNATIEGRINFVPDEFAAEYNLGNPLAGNFYLTQRPTNNSLFFDRLILG